MLGTWDLDYKLSLKKNVIIVRGKKNIVQPDSIYNWTWAGQFSLSLYKPNFYYIFMTFIHNTCSCEPW